MARTPEIARWRETGEVAYGGDFALRLTLDHDRIVRIVVMPGARCPRSAVAAAAPLMNRLRLWYWRACV
jgi:hypothetical protein